MCVYLYHIQKTTLKVGSAIYKLVGMVKYYNRQCLHNPLISKPGVAKPALTSKTSLSLKKKNKTTKSDDFYNDFLKKSVLFHATSIKTKSDTRVYTKCAGNTECKVHISLFTDLVTVTKLPTNLSKSTGEKHTCSICGQGYSFRSGLSKHMRSAHNDVESGLVTCTICNSRFVYMCLLPFNSCLLLKSGKSSKTYSYIFNQTIRCL